MLRALFLLIPLAPWLQAQTTPPSDSTFEGIAQSISSLSEITGLQPLKKVDTGLMNRAELKRFLEDRIKEEVKPEEIRIEELALKRFGLVPKDFDLKATTIDLLTEQAAAFYDYQKKKLFVLQEDSVKVPVPAGMAKEAQAMIVVHELAHALADQHFNLGKFIKKGRTDDASLARTAVMEGQATWLMMEVMARKSGQSLEKSPFMVELMGTGARRSMLEQYPVLAKSPLYIQASLLFPYTGGLKFQQAVVEKLGKAAFAQVFKQPPATTQQVLHAEKYFTAEMPSKPTLPQMAAPRDWNTVMDGTVGEFDHAVLVEQYLSKKDADELTPHWRGGQVALLEHKRGKHVALLYSSAWSDTSQARRMFEAYQRVLRGKWKSFKVTSEDATSIAGTGDDGFFVLTLDGTIVRSSEGAKAQNEFATANRQK